MTAIPPVCVVAGKFDLAVTFLIRINVKTLNSNSPRLSARIVASHSDRNAALDLSGFTGAAS
jgi:hypothetical protein